MYINTYIKGILAAGHLLIKIMVTKVVNVISIQNARWIIPYFLLFHKGYIIIGDRMNNCISTAKYQVWPTHYNHNQISMRT